MAFVDLGKAFDQVPRKVIWLVLRKLGVEEWIVRLVQGMLPSCMHMHGAVSQSSRKLQDCLTKPANFLSVLQKILVCLTNVL